MKDQKTMLFILLGLLIILGGGFILLQRNKSPQPTTNQIQNQTPETQEENQTTNEAKPENMNEETMEKKYTMAEIEKHNKPEDCWLLINGRVYDVTEYIKSQKHPGGETILQGCGKEATELFEKRPMGSGTPHSEKARQALEKYYIGDFTE